MTTNENSTNTDNSNLNSTSSSAEKSHDSAPEIIIKATWSLGWAAITAVCSLFAAIPFIQIFFYGGHQPSAWGFEYIFCFAAPIPGIIGYIIASVALASKHEAYARSLISSVIGVAVACVSILIFYWILAAPEIAKDNKRTKENNIEVAFFQSAIQGNYDEKAIRDHYANNGFPGVGRNDLIDRTRMKVSPQALELLIELADKRPDIQGYLATQPESTTKLKLKVSDSPEVAAVLPLARDINTPPEVLYKLATHKDQYCAEQASENQNAPFEVKAIVDIRRCYTQNPFYDNDCRLKFDADNVWSTLANDERESVRIWVASNPNAPMSMFNKLKSDKSAEVRAWVMLNNSAPANLRQEIARNFSKKPDRLIEALKHDREFTHYIEFKLLRFKDIQPEVLNALAEGDDWNIQREVAKHPKTPVHTLESLSHHREWSVRELVINNPNTPISILQKIASGKPGGANPDVERAKEVISKRTQ